MSKNLRNIVKRILNESDFDWIDEDLIKVGNCFIIKDNMDEDIHIKVTEIETHHSNQLKDVEKWQLPYLSVHFDSVDGNRVLGPGLNFNYYVNGGPGIELSYSEVEQMLDKGDMLPIECK
jgi:hypothetical protein